jgi:hypothetical protein
MCNTLEDFKKEVEPYKNTLVLNYVEFTVVRLIDVVERDDDYCWVMDHCGEGIFYLSCCLGFISLKGVIPVEDYERMVSIWNLNNEIKAI